MISSFLFHFTLNGKKKVPHNHKIPLWFHPGYIHTNLIYRLNLRFSGQLYSHIRRRRSTAQKCIGLISKEYLRTQGIYKLIKAFLNIDLISVCSSQTLFLFPSSRKKKSFTTVIIQPFIFTSSHYSSYTNICYKKKCLL